MSDYIVEHQAEQNRFVVHIQDHVSRLDYELAPDHITFTHTVVPAALQGRGVAAALVRSGLAWARSLGLRIVPQCSYVQAFMQREKPIV